MGSRKTNARGRQLQEVINKGYINCIDDDSTTFEKNDYKEKIDWILASQPLHSLISNVETHATIGTLSGRKPLTFDIPIGIEPKPASPRLSLNFKAANWSKFRSKLNEQLMLWNKHRHITSAIDIEEYTSLITNSIKSATQEAILTKSIIAHRQFFLSGSDTCDDGTVISIRTDHIPGKNQVYTSPTIKYSSLDCYYEMYPYQVSNGQWHQAKIVLQCRQQPGTYKSQGETVGSRSKRICNIILNDRIEIFTTVRVAVIPDGLLIQLKPM
ncbi:unnamed protein product [Rotaria sp. Silwood2]|nr:unnamed protein product [Rotaria sp. Silwood2]